MKASIRYLYRSCVLCWHPGYLCSPLWSGKPSIDSCHHICLSSQKIWLGSSDLGGKWTSESFSCVSENAETCFSTWHLFPDIYHPGLAENIAPNGGPGSDIIWIKIIKQTNCRGARWFFKPVQDGGPIKIQVLHIRVVSENVRIQTQRIDY